VLRESLPSAIEKLMTWSKTGNMPKVKAQFQPAHIDIRKILHVGLTHC